jgi:hypothetical protein
MKLVRASDECVVWWHLDAPLGAILNSPRFLPWVSGDYIDVARRRCAIATWLIAPAKGVPVCVGAWTRGRIPGLLNIAPSGAAFYVDYQINDGDGKDVDLKAHDGFVGVVYPGLRGLKAHLPGAS